uniref:Uncharacterized protein n=1 Tax=Trichuris muris TaxID=70415 RepID=A0A5S6QUN3_TRIMR
MSLVSLLLLILSSYVSAQLFPSGYYGALQSVVAVRPPGFHLYDRNIYGRKNACEALADIADDQLQWARKADIRPPERKRQYLETLRNIKRDAKRSGRRDQDLLQCKRFLGLYMTPATGLHSRPPLGPHYPHYPGLH